MRCETRAASVVENLKPVRIDKNVEKREIMQGVAEQGRLSLFNPKPVQIDKNVQEADEQE